MSERPKSQPGEGERLHARQRRHFWKLIGALALIGFVIGIVSGLFLGLTEDNRPLSPGLTWLAIAAIIAAILLVIYGSWRFFVSVDEVEVADNLWGSLIGFYAYGIALPAWWALAKIGTAPQPDHWVIYGFSFAVALAAYGIRKWQSRSAGLD